MATKFLSCDQHSTEWLKAREGRITASRISDVISYLTRANGKGKQKGDPSGDRDAYMYELRAERLTGRATEKHVSKYMDHGSEYEEKARRAYGAAFEVFPEKVGFAVHPTLDYSGASPDSLVGDDGMLEIKCPQAETHFAYMEAKVVPAEHEPQMMWGMEVCERQWCDFVSYHPDAPPDLRIFVCRMEYDPKRAAYLRAEVIKFNSDVEASIARLRGSNAEVWTPKEIVKNQLRRSLEIEDSAYITDDDIRWAMAEQGVGHGA